MKYKLLIGGGNNTMLRDFFLNAHSNFMCLSTSSFWEDVSRHFVLFEPHVLIWLMDHKDKEHIALLRKVKSTSTFSGIPIIVITDDDTKDFLESTHVDCIDLTICRPITIANIYAKIEKFLTDREAEKERLIEEEKAQIEKEKLLKSDKPSFDRDVQAATERAAEKAAARADGRKHVLVVDDDRNVLRTLKGTLDSRYKVTTMITGKMAERYLETKSCDIILLDYQMPGENGPEVFQKIKQIDSAKNIPIVFLTGVAESDKIAEVLAMKPQGYLLKPIDAKRLISTLENVIGA